MTLARLENFAEEDTALLAYLLREAANCEELPWQKRARYRDFAEWLEIRMRVRTQRNVSRKGHWRRRERISVGGDAPQPVAASV
ncbi:MAG: hypothetical protein AAF530_09900 [Pseudomonadota bacterium]